MESLDLEDDCIQQVKLASIDDSVLLVLQDVIQQSWPDSKTHVPDCIHVYYNFWNKPTVQGPFVFKSDLPVICIEKRNDGFSACSLPWHWEIHLTGKRLHLHVLASNVDKVEGVHVHLQVWYMPGSSGYTCQRITTTATRLWMMPMIQDWHWLEQASRSTLLVVCNYYSKYMEVERVWNMNTWEFTEVLKPVFAPYRVPAVPISDNRLWFDSEEFASFAKQWGF